MSACSPSSSPTFTVTVADTTCVRAASVVQTTFDSYSDPCGYLTSSLADQIRTDMSVPPTSTLTCAVVSIVNLSDGRRVYTWDVTATWTD